MSTGFPSVGVTSDAEVEFDAESIRPRDAAVARAGTANAYYFDYWVGIPTVCTTALRVRLYSSTYYE